MSIFKFLACPTNPIIMFQFALLYLDRNHKELVSLLPAVFCMDSQFSRHSFKLHWLCRILLIILSLVKRSTLLKESTDSPFIKRLHWIWPSLGSNLFDNGLLHFLSTIILSYWYVIHCVFFAFIPDLIDIFSSFNSMT